MALTSECNSKDQISIAYFRKGNYNLIFNFFVVLLLTIFKHFRYEQYAERLKNFKVRKDDIWLISYPKSGTTWSQEMVWLLGSNLNYDKAKEIKQYLRFPFIE